jgi:sulfatase maturation enzyme AslB (radical SAM superfamily)
MEELKQIGFYTMYNERVKNASSTSQMKRCEMIITEYCNFKCPYCRGLKSEIYEDRRIKQLSLEEIKRNIDLWCQNIPLENIRFSGGEPTLHKDIKEVVSYAKFKGIKRIAISSNGSSKTELYRELVEFGANDFSISLDACCAEDGDKMAGNIKGAFDIVANNIRELSKLTYVTVGVVLTPENVQKTIDTIVFADSLGVSDIRIISAAQWNKPIEALGNIDPVLRAKYPILNYRVHNSKNGTNVRGMNDSDSKRCGLTLDDSVIAGDFHFPCVIYMRELGNPIGRVGPNMREDRKAWSESHDCQQDKICKDNCLDVCIDYNNKFREYHGSDLVGKRYLPVI